MEAFNGFPGGAVASSAIPNQFFAQVLPAIDTLAELQVTLHVLWRTSPGPRRPQLIALDELVSEPLLLVPLANESGGAKSAIERGVRTAIRRGTFVETTIESPPTRRTMVGVNNQRARRAIADLLTVPVAQTEPSHPLLADDPSVVSRPPIFALYEANIGLIQPILADELRRAGELFPSTWVEQAFREAVRYNKRNWRYVKRILDKWATEGRDRHATHGNSVKGSPDSATKREWVQTYRSGGSLPDL